MDWNQLNPPGVRGVEGLAPFLQLAIAPVKLNHLRAQPRRLLVLAAVVITEAVSEPQPQHHARTGRPYPFHTGTLLCPEPQSNAQVPSELFRPAAMVKRDGQAGWKRVDR